MGGYPVRMPRVLASGLRVIALMVAPLALVLGMGVAPAAQAAEWTVGTDGASVQAVVDRAAAGDTILIPTGDWPGPVRIEKTLTLKGIGGVIQGGDSGTVLTLDAPNIVLDGVHVAHSGDELFKNDACIRLDSKAAGSTVQNCHMEHCAFGLWLHEVKGVKVLNNRIVGTLEGHRSTRGNGIQLFDSDGLIVDGNHVTGGRDGIYVSATEDSEIINNRLTGTRYGIHYMFSYDNTVSGNIATNNGSGFALMGSLRLQVHNNTVRDNSEHGIMLRDVQYTHITGNISERNGHGLFIYSCTENTITGNRFAHNDVGAKIWAGSKRNKVSGNRFIGNTRQIFYVSTQDLVWGADGEPGNIWSDYVGWDQDGDGIGDRPYTIDSFSSHLLHRYPQAALLMRSPALELLAHMQERMPVLKVPTVVDMHPLMGVVGANGGGS